MKDEYGWQQKMAYFGNIIEESDMLRVCSEKKSPNIFFNDREITFLDITAPRETF